MLPEAAYSEVDALILVEIWATKAVEMPDFYSVCCSASRTHKVGRPKVSVAVLYNQKLGNMKTLLAEENRIVIEGEAINMVAMYEQPPNSNEGTELEKKLICCLQLVSDKGNTALAGDFNVRYDRPDEKRTITIVDTISDFGLWIANDLTQYTFEGPMGSPTIDLVATSMAKDEVCYRGCYNSLRGWTPGEPQSGEHTNKPTPGSSRTRKKPVAVTTPDHQEGVPGRDLHGLHRPQRRYLRVQ